MSSAETASTARARARARRSWPVRKFALGDEPGDDILGNTTTAERLEMVEELSQQAWALSARPLPDYHRSAIPIRVVRRRGASAKDAPTR